jgi:hypothetical protein
MPTLQHKYIVSLAAALCRSLRCQQRTTGTEITNTVERNTVVIYTFQIQINRNLL